MAALTYAVAFRLKGHATDAGALISFDMNYGANSSDGSITLGGGTLQLRYASGDLFVKAGDRFWRQVGGLGNSADDKAALALLHGKWVRLPAGMPGLSDIGQLAKRTKFLQLVAASDDNSSFTRGPSKTIDAIPVVSVVGSDDGTTIYVPASGTPFPIRIEDRSTDGGSFDLSHYDVPFAGPMPPAGQIVDLPH
jgi:hypothetical protein